MPAEMAGSTEDETTEDATWLDGNALGGLLQEVFRTDALVIASQPDRRIVSLEGGWRMQLARPQAVEPA
jgi:hypothetical protein